MILSKKIVLLGYFGVGKSSIIRKFVTNEFSSDYKVTIGVHILKKEIKLNTNDDDDDVALIIWDLEGTDNIDVINKAYLLGTHSFIYVYDITRPKTYSKLKENLKSLKEKFPTSLIKTVGNKIDLLDPSSIESHKATLDNNAYLSSAKTGESIETLFQDIARELAL